MKAIGLILRGPYGMTIGPAIPTWVFDTNGIALVGLHLQANAESDTGCRPASQAALEWIQVN